MLTLERVCKTYVTAQGPTPVLKGIDLFIGRGEFVSVMGPSGSGKSTLAAILGCLTSASEGSYRLDGVEVTSLSAKELARLRNEKIGFIFQDFNLLDGMTALENVALPLVYAGVGARERSRRARAALEKVNLGDRLGHLPKQLSGGQKQRVAIARALVTDPILIFADEPTGALDAKNTTDVMILLQSLNLAGHTIVQVTHAPEDAAFSKRVVHIADGLVVRDEAVENYDVASRAMAVPDANMRRDSAHAVLWSVAAKSPPVEAPDLKAVRRLYRETQTAEAAIPAVRALVRIPGPEPSQMLHKLSRHPEWAVRAELVKLVNAKVHDLAVGFFLAGLRDESAWVRFSSLRQLAQLPTGLQLSFGTGDILRCLVDTDERVRAAAVMLVKVWGDPTLYTTLRGIALDDPNQRVRSNALEALEEYGKRDATLVDEIVGIWRVAAGHSHHRIASSSAVLLCPHAPSEALATIRGLARSALSVERAAAAWAFGALQDPEKVAVDLTTMARTERDEMVVGQLARSLARLTTRGLSLAQQVEMTLGPAATMDAKPLPMVG